jgi:hypothetical protein
MGLEPEVVADNAMRRGDYLEPAIAQWWAEDHGRVVCKATSIRHPKYPHLGDTADYLVEGEPLELLDEVESAFDLQAVPMNWPVGEAPAFQGVYDLRGNQMLRFQRTEHNKFRAPVQVAGIDDPARAHCMGLIREFDLDFVITSEREWACYAELPGVAICQLQRREGVDAVYVSRWTWDGRARRMEDDPDRRFPLA